MRGMKALLAAVIVMGVLILLGTAVLVATVLHRALQGPVAHLAPRPGAALPPGPASTLTLDQPPGTRIAALARQSDRLVDVTLVGGGLPDRVLVWDFGANRAIAILRLGR